MRKIFLLIAIASACSPKPSEVDPNISAVENNLTSYVHFEGDSLWNIEARMKFYGVPGAAVAVIKDNKIVWTKAYGIMDKETNEPVKTTTLFQAGSISKPVAAYGALKTVEMGKVDLNKDVNTYLTAWKLPDNEFTKEKKVTLEHLLSHTGGLTVHGFPGYRPDIEAPTLLQVLDGAGPANSAPIRVSKAPETGFRYSGGGYCVMQQMLIDVHGKSFPEIEQELVLGPLDMNNSTYDQPLNAEKLKLAATGYLPNHEQTAGKRHTYPEMAAAGLWTTAEDLAKFAIDLQLTIKGRSSNVLSQEMAKRMTTPVKNERSIGLGIFMDDRKGEIYFGHGGWDEGFSSELLAHRDKGYGVVVLTNSNHPAFISEVIRSVARVYNWDNYTSSYKKLSIDTTWYPSIRGRYRNNSDGGISISTKEGKLYFKYLREFEPAEMFRITDSTYLTGNSDSPIQFKIKSDGTADLIIHEEKGSVVHDRLKDDEKVPYDYFIAGDYKRALKEYQALMKANPNDPGVDEGNMTENVVRLYEQGRKDLALELMNIIIALHPNSTEAKANLEELKSLKDK